MEEVKHSDVHRYTNMIHIYIYIYSYIHIFSMFRNEEENFGKHRGCPVLPHSTIITGRGLACIIISDLLAFPRPSS